MASRADHDAFRQALLTRIADAAFELEEGAPLPRTRAELDARVKAGAPRLDPVFKLFSKAIASAAAELEKTLGALRAAAKHPSGRAAVQDMFAQLEELFPADLIAWVPLARLEHYPRYLRAVQARLARAVTDPPKDAGKLANVAPLWMQFVAKRRVAKDRAAADELRWAFEELRVAVFAPELKTPAPVSAAKVSAALAALR
jgi:ATP-dependent helicase HrpA